MNHYIDPETGKADIFNAEDEKITVKGKTLVRKDKYQGKVAATTVTGAVPTKGGEASTPAVGKTAPSGSQAAPEKVTGVDKA